MTGEAGGEMEKGLVTLDTSDATHQPWVEKRDTVASMMPADGKKKTKNQPSTRDPGNGCPVAT